MVMNNTPEIMGRGVSSGGGQSSLDYLFGSGGEPKPNAESPPTDVHVAATEPPPPPKTAAPITPPDITKQIPAGIQSSKLNNYIRADGQNTGNFITDRPSTKVHAAPGGGSSLGYLFGDGASIWIGPDQLLDQISYVEIDGHLIRFVEAYRFLLFLFERRVNVWTGLDHLLNLTGFAEIDGPWTGPIEAYQKLVDHGLDLLRFTRSRFSLLDRIGFAEICGSWIGPVEAYQVQFGRSGRPNVHRYTKHIFNK
ncbi:unnamed protein product [Lactuca saligna]|uniref:Uncharacterized protein n=1 Tax=Lactuca saligna TaxID=75948 RepID=A0AA35Z242_LACSI|nr:unnamed protein product [Lactuca saligna]